MQSTCEPMSGRTDFGQMYGSSNISIAVHFRSCISFREVNEQESLESTRLRRLDQYVLDFLRRRSSHKCADLFALEAKVPEQQLGKRSVALPWASSRPRSCNLTVQGMHRQRSTHRRASCTSGGASSGRSSWPKQSLRPLLRQPATLRRA